MKYSVHTGRSSGSIKTSLRPARSSYRTNRKSAQDYQECLKIPAGENPTYDHGGFTCKRLILFQEPKPAVDTVELYLARNCGFEFQRLAKLEDLDLVNDLSEGNVILQGKDTSEDRDRYEQVLANPKRGFVLLLLESTSSADGTPDVIWPTNDVILLRKPVNGQHQMSALAHICD